MKHDSASTEGALCIFYCDKTSYIVIANCLVGFESKELPATTKLGDKSHDHP